MSQEEDHCWETIQRIDNPWSAWYNNSSKLKTQTRSQINSDTNQAITTSNTQNYTYENQQNNYERPKITSEHPKQSESSSHQRSLSNSDNQMQKIAEDNFEFIKQNQNTVPTNGETIYDKDHINIHQQLSKIRGKKRCQIFVNTNSTIWSSIYCHRHSYDTIFVLNFADAFKPGGGYLNGRSAQEESLCRQTLLYSSLENNDMYTFNSNVGPEGSDVMIYSPNVLVIRDDEYRMIPERERFTVNIISSPAVDNRERVSDAEEIMENRIRKIISLAAFKAQQQETEGGIALILGAFGCGVFKNDPKVVASLFAKVLNYERMKEYFDCVIFPMYKQGEVYQIFQSFLNK